MGIDLIRDNNDHLVERAATGDQAAIEALLMHYQPTIARFAARFCTTPEDVEDAVQETLWIASRKIGTLRVTHAFISWLFKVVRNECYRLFHHGNREVAEGSVARIEAAAENPELSIFLRRDIAHAIASLPVAYRQILIMRDVEEMTAPDVATALGITMETVKSRLHRGRHLLRQMLSHWHEPE